MSALSLAQFVSLFGSVADGGQQLVENGNNANVAIANSMNIAIASASALASTIPPAFASVAGVQAIAGQFAGIGLIADFSTSVVNLIETGHREGFDSTDFRDGVTKLVFQSLLTGAVVGMAAIAGANPATLLITAGLGFGLSGLMADSARQFIQGEPAPYAKFIASALKVFPDPLTLDLDGDGIELRPLGTAGQTGASTVFFDFDGDGFKERTGWVKADDGMLAIDLNSNGLIDNGGELFGQPSRDGYEVLETYDTFADGVIDAKDAAFARLRIWRDLDQDGVTDAGELKTLTESGITSISLTRTDVTGTNQGHDRGFQGGFTRTNGTTGTAETIYFATDRRDTRVDPTPGFTLVAGVDKLPQLPGSGQINSIAWKATQDAAFRADWTALTDQAGMQLRIA
jgi:hypothetical protein